MKNYPDFILTTASKTEGYKITAQHGLVFGETVFKHGFLSKLSASVSNTFDSLSWNSREMSGSINLIEAAREYAYDKMVNEARNRGPMLLLPLIQITLSETM